MAPRSSSPLLQQRCRSQFDRIVRERGQRYFEQGRVTIQQSSDDLVVADVKGSRSRPYFVNLAVEGVDPLFLSTECDCPHYTGGELCKHLWATFLGLDAEGWRQHTPEHVDAVILHELDMDSWDEDEVDGAWDDVMDAPLGLRGAPEVHAARTQRGLATPARWRDLVRSMMHVSEDEPFHPPSTPVDGFRQPWFVINPGVSVQSGGLVVDIHHQVRKKNGEMGRLQREGVSTRTISRFSDAGDRRLLALLLGNQAENGASYGFELDFQDSHAISWRIVPAMHELLLPALCATTRLVVHEGSGMDAASFQPLTWDDGGPWTLQLDMCDAPGGDGWELHAELVRGEQRMPPGEVELALNDGLMVAGQRIARLADAAHARWLAMFQAQRSFHVPREDGDAFLRDWWSMSTRPCVELPQELRLQPLQVSPAGRIALRSPRAARGGSATRVRVEVDFDYGSASVAWDAPENALVDLDNRVLTERDREREGAMLQRLVDLGVGESSGSRFEPPALEVSARNAERLQSSLPGEGWLVQVDGERLHAAGAFAVSISSGVDWFDLDLKLDYDGQSVQLPALLEALEQGRGWIPLADGSRGLVPDEWLARNRALMNLGHSESGRLRFAPGQALFLDALLAQQRTEVSMDQRFERWRDRLAGVQGIKPAKPPRSFKGTLRDYQCMGLGWLRFLAELGLGGCLADDMGLGKTVQVLALLEWWRTRSTPPPQPSLVVVPRSLVWNWLEEAARFTPRLRVLDYTGARRAEAFERFAENDVVIATYGTVRRDIARLSRCSFHYAILDEAQAVKNAGSQASKACRALNATHRLAITGTPVENHLGELWSLFEFLTPGLLGAAKAFEPLGKAAARTDPEAARVLGQGLAPFILRRTKAQVLPDLPEKTEQTLMVDLPGAQRQLYDELRDYYRALLDDRIAAQGLNRSKIHVLEALLRLRQAACHPGLIDQGRRGESSAKLDALLETLREVVAEGHRALVFSQFTRLLAILRQHLDAAGLRYAYLDGRTRNRAARVKSFQEDADCPLFLISLKAGGQGLNLTAADYVFILDPWWNPAVEAQAVDRSHRIGQTRAVFAYRLIARDTVEEKILALKRDKQALADAIVAQDESLLRTLTAADLQQLLGA